MTWYEGQPIREGGISIGPPDRRAARARRDEPTFSSSRDWFGESENQKDIVYFSIFQDELPVGEIFVHDIGAERTDAALVGYSVFRPSDRGQGVGSRALSLLTRWADTQTDLNELVVITSADNAASARIADKAGFVRSGSPREDPTGLCLIRRRLPQHN